MMGMLRKIIEIDEKKCTGCGDCIPNCMEGALQIIDGKARLISDLFCDGLGACMGHCPEDAIAIVEREAEPYDEYQVMAKVVNQGTNTITAHLKHLKDHGAEDLYQQAVNYLNQHHIALPEELNNQPAPLVGGCPGTQVRIIERDKQTTKSDETARPVERPSALTNWPVQLKLMPVSGPYLDHADVLIAADCAAFSYANFHADFMQNKVVMIGCPKLDDSNFYQEKLTALFSQNKINSITLVHMEVPCCFGLVELVKQAVKHAGKIIPLATVTVGIKGQLI